jgi:glyoxylate/hydroxypyruvate reductase
MSILVAITGWDIALWTEQVRLALAKTSLSEQKIVSLGEPFDRREVSYVVAWKAPHGSLTGLPNLSAILCLGAGVDHLMADPKLPDAAVFRIMEENLTTQMSEYVVMHSLLYLRQHQRYTMQQSQKIWQDDRSQVSAQRVRVGILGFGTLGQDAGHKLKTLGFDVAGWTRTQKSTQATYDIPVFFGTEGLDNFLARTDILVSLLPLTPETRGILNKGMFEKLAHSTCFNGPVLINAGRGGLQVEEDILSALDAGTLKAATLDVFNTEPLPEDSPFWTHPAITLTPHNAAVSDPASVCQHIMRQIAALEKGETPQGFVDRTAGY